MPDVDTRQLTIRVPEQIYQELIDASYKARKAGERKSVNTVVVEALEMWAEVEMTKKILAPVARERK